MVPLPWWWQPDRARQWIIFPLRLRQQMAQQPVCLARCAFYGILWRDKSHAAVLITLNGIFPMPPQPLWSRCWFHIIWPCLALPLDGKLGIVEAEQLIPSQQESIFFPLLCLAMSACSLCVTLLCNKFHKLCWRQTSNISWWKSNLDVFKRLLWIVLTDFGENFRDISR